MSTKDQINKRLTELVEGDATVRSLNLRFSGAEAFDALVDVIAPQLDINIAKPDLDDQAPDNGIIRSRYYLVDDQPIFVEIRDIEHRSADPEKIVFVTKTTLENMPRPLQQRSSTK